MLPVLYEPNGFFCIRILENWKKRSRDKRKDSRWRENSPLVSIDGVTFYVNAGVGDTPKCYLYFRDIVSLSEKLGYKIEPIS